MFIINILPIYGFEPRTSCIRSDRSANWAKNHCPLNKYFVTQTVYIRGGGVKWGLHRKGLQVVIMKEVNRSLKSKWRDRCPCFCEKSPTVNWTQRNSRYISSSSCCSCSRHSQSRCHRDRQIQAETELPSLCTNHFGKNVFTKALIIRWPPIN